MLPVAVVYPVLPNSVGKPSEETCSLVGFALIDHVFSVAYADEAKQLSKPTSSSYPNLER